MHREVVGAGWGMQLSGRVQNMHMKRKELRKVERGVLTLHEAFPCLILVLHSYSGSVVIESMYVCSHKGGATRTARGTHTHRQLQWQWQASPQATIQDM